MQLALDDRGGRRKIPPVDVVDENGKRQERHQPSRRYISLNPPDCRYHVVSDGVSAPKVANRSKKNCSRCNCYARNLRLAWPLGDTRSTDSESRTGLGYIGMAIPPSFHQTGL